MRQEAKSAGQFKPENFSAFDKLQIVTIQEILEGARMNLPLMEEVTKKTIKQRLIIRRVYFRNKMYKTR